MHQSGNVGACTAGLPPAEYVDYPYVEWYSDQNGRVVLELQPAKIEVMSGRRRVSLTRSPATSRGETWPNSWAIWPPR